jgi:hypothetical protein
LDTLIRQNASSDDESSTNTHSLYGLNAEFLNPAPKIPGLAKSRAGQGLFQNLSTVKLHIRHRAELVSAEDPNIPSSPTNTNTSTPPLAIFKMDFDLVPVIMRSTFSDVLFEIFGYAVLGSGVAKNYDAIKHILLGLRLAINPINQIRGFRLIYLKLS